MLVITAVVMEMARVVLVLVGRTPPSQVMPAIPHPQVRHKEIMVEMDFLVA